jgi:excisionase family DNA binding protein
MTDANLFAARDDVRLAYNIDEFGRAIGVGRTAVKRAIKSGELRIARLGTRVIISREAAQDYIKALEWRSAHKSAA